MNDVDEITEALNEAWDSEESEDQTDVVNSDVDPEKSEQETGDNEQDTPEVAEGDELEVDADQQDQIDPDPKSSVEAPAMWKQEDKDMFSKQTPEAQEFLLRRSKEMDAAYTQKTMEWSDFTKTYQPINELFQQHPNLNPTQTIQEWANIALALQSNPEQTLRNLASHYNVDINGEIDPNGDIEQPSAEVVALRKEINDIRNHMSEKATYDQETASRNKLDEIERFSQEKDDKGNLIRPYIDEAMPLMSTLAKAQIAEGKSPDLQNLYEMAIYANPEIRAKVQQAEKQKQLERKKQEDIAKATKAKKRTTTLVSESGQPEPTELSIEEELAKQWDASMTG